MNTPQIELILLTEAVRRYLYASFLDGKKHFLDFEGDELYWAFNDVDHQLCIALFDEEKEIDFLESNLQNSIEKRRTEEIDLIVYKDSIATEFLKNLNKTASRKCTFIGSEDLLAKQNKPDESMVLKKIDNLSDLNSIKGINECFPLKTWMKDTEQLFTRSYFSAWQYYSSSREIDELVVFCMKFEDLVIIEILETDFPSLWSLHQILDMLTTEISIFDLPILLVTKENTAISLETVPAFDHLILDYFNKSSRKDDMKLIKVPFAGVLKRKTDYYESLYQLSITGLPKHNDLPKNWDSFAALSTIKNNIHIDKDSAILDAGGEYYSAIMHQLAAFDFKNLFCINTVFQKSSCIGNINYIPGDITATSFDNKTFKAITCLSVIEHGVDLEAFFAESNRILADGGLLFLSTDYWHKPINTHQKEAYGVPVKIFTQQDIEELILKAEKHGLFLPGPVDFKCVNKIVQWDDLRYTFIYLTFYKR